LYMKIRIGGKKIGQKQENCSMKTCGTSLTNQPIYEWNFFNQDAGSSFDGEEHRVTLCRTCYEKLEAQFQHHVVSSNQLNNFMAYGGTVDELDEREKERLHPSYLKKLEEEAS